MKKTEQHSFFKRGIWIKEQQGALTMGTLGDDAETVVIPNALGSKIFEFENDMIDAIYGEEKIAFNPSVVDFHRMMDNLKKEFNHINLRISLTDDQRHGFKGSYDEIHRVLEHFILSALPQNPDDVSRQMVYINASLLEDHLCLILRDALSLSSPEQLKEEIRFIKNELNGEISYKSTGSQKTYYDIVIPSQSKV